MRHITHIVTLFISVTLILGCGVKRPAGFPETAPCKITVTKNGVPLDGASVSFYREGGNGVLSIGGTANASGVAEIRTGWGTYSVKGAPLGMCKIIVDKYIEIPPDSVSGDETATYTPEQAAAYEAKRHAEIDALRIVPRKFTESATTPLTIDVSPSGAEKAVDVGE